MKAKAAAWARERQPLLAELEAEGIVLGQGAGARP